MAKAVFTVNVNAENPYLHYLKLINGVMQLTEKELQVLTLFMQEDTKERFGKESRQRLSKELNIKNINVYVKKFKDKKLVVKTKKRGVYEPVPLLIPRDSIEFKLKYVEG